MAITHRIVNLRPSALRQNHLTLPRRHDALTLVSQTHQCVSSSIAFVVLHLTNFINTISPPALSVYSTRFVQLTIVILFCFYNFISSIMFITRFRRCEITLQLIYAHKTLALGLSSMTRWARSRGKTIILCGLSRVESRGHFRVT